MKIHEYQAKEILKSYKIPVPTGVVVDTLGDGLSAVEKLAYPVVIKAQVHVGGRGKAGAIKIVSNQQELERELPSILKMKVKGLEVKKVLIEKVLNIEKQFYLGIIVERTRQRNAVIISGEGGVEIEEVAKLHPQKIITILLKAAGHLEPEDISKLTSFLGLLDSTSDSFCEIVKSLFAMYVGIEAELLEINPLVLTTNKEWIACDAKVLIDDNALFRHEELKVLKKEVEDNELEAEAHKRGLAYVKLSGNIGIIGNGAGLVMATMDEVKRVGGAPANFLDIGGGAKREVVQNALEIIYQDKQVEGVFINVFGGITRCDEVAKGIIQVMEAIPKDIPLVLRLTGTRAQEGQALLEERGLMSVRTMEEGAKKIVSLVNNKT